MNPNHDQHHLTHLNWEVGGKRSPQRRPLNWRISSLWAQRMSPEIDRTKESPDFAKPSSAIAIALGVRPSNRPRLGLPFTIHLASFMTRLPI